MEFITNLLSCFGECVEQVTVSLYSLISCHEQNCIPLNGKEESNAVDMQV